jgi:hypothetical protein
MMPWFLAAESIVVDMRPDRKVGSVQASDIPAPVLLHNLVAPDAASYDNFGYRVAMSDDGASVAISAASSDPAATVNVGSVYVFSVATGDLIRKFTAGDGAKNDTFGMAVSLNSDGTRLAVGSWTNDDPSEHGSLYLFDVSTGDLLHKVIPGDLGTSDQLGVAVSLSAAGTEVAVGSHRADTIALDAGSVYLFHVVTGELLRTFVSDKTGDYDWFGYSVSLSADGTVLAAGAFRDDDKGLESGSVYIFDVASGSKLHKLVPNDGASKDHFGISVDLNSDGTRLAVGANGDGDLGSSSGSVYLYNATSGGLLHKLVVDDGGANHNFGGSVSLSADGAIVAVGAWGAESYHGCLYLFDGMTGAQLSKVTPSGIGTYTYFGWSVSLSSHGARAVAGAFNDNSNGPASGSAFLFSVATSTPAPTPSPTQPPMASPTASPTAGQPPLPIAPPPGAASDGVIPTTGAGVGVIHDGTPPAQVSAFGDPHLVNVHGQRFDILQQGTHLLMQIPRWAPPHRTLLRVDALAKRVGDACADIYFTALNITGGWVPYRRGLHFSAIGKRRIRRTWQKLGLVSIKVVRGHTADGTRYLNVFAKHLSNPGYPVGGLLGEDDHTAASAQDPSCGRSLSL